MASPPAPLPTFKACQCPVSSRNWEYEYLSLRFRLLPSASRKNNLIFSIWLQDIPALAVGPVVRRSRRRSPRSEYEYLSLRFRLLPSASRKNNLIFSIWLQDIPALAVGPVVRRSRRRSP